MSKKNNKSSSNPMKPLILITVIVVVLISAVVILTNMQNSESGDITLENHPPIENQPTIGDLNAPVSVVEFGDYKCPSCGVWSEQYFPQLKKDFIDTGKITFTYINVLFHENESFLGSLAGESVWMQDPDAFWDFSKALYQAQPESQDHDNYWLTLEKVLEVAENSVPHIDLKLLEEDIVNMTYKDAVLLDERLVGEYNVQMTPSIIINGTMVENPFDYNRITELIEGGQ